MLKRGVARRMSIYLAEMFPIPERLALSALLYVSFATLLGRIHRVEARLFSLHTAAGILSVFTLLLMLRLMDELKDKRVDSELFRERPLPSGRVLEADIRLSLVVTIAGFLLANLWSGKAALMALLVFAYALLMFNYFFIPRILRQYLLLNLATHNPIVPLLFIHLLSLFAADHGLGRRAIDWRSSLLLVAMNWATFFAWEIARKIRAREEENAYVTYSQIFGGGGAALVSLGAQTMTLAIGLYFYRQLSLSVVYLGILAGGYAVTACGHARFLLTPNPRTSKLRPFVEFYSFAALVAQTIEHTPPFFRSI